MFVWIRDKGIAQSDSGKGGTLWAGGTIVGNCRFFGANYRNTYDDKTILDTTIGY